MKINNNNKFLFEIFDDILDTTAVVITAPITVPIKSLEIIEDALDKID